MKVGTRYGSLVVLGKAESYRKPNGNTEGCSWCECDCGNVVAVRNYHLKSGNSKTCGCSRLKADGFSGDPIYSIWAGMIQRCENPNTLSFHNYGGRGISVCRRWKESVAAFAQDMGPRPDGYTLDRVDNDGDYTPDNCRWASLQEQQRNKRTNRVIEFNGEKKLLVEWASEKGISVKALWFRLYDGWSVERALTTPVQRRSTNI